MKKTLYFLAFVGFLAPQVSFAQIWFRDGAQWEYSEFGTSHATVRYLTINGDTIVDGKSCKRMSGRIVYEENDSVFYYKDDAFKLIYDFSLAPGDTFKMMALNCDTLRNYVLDSITSIQTVGQTRRVQHFSHNGFSGIQLIEGIGQVGYLSPNGVYGGFFFWDIGGACALDYFWYWFCTFKDDIILYAPGGQCLSPTNEPHFATQVIISPNPSSHHITLSYPTDIKLLKASLLSTTGATLFTKENPSNELILDTETTGLFFLKLEFEEGIIMKKIIRN